MRRGARTHLAVLQYHLLVPSRWHNKSGQLYTTAGHVPVLQMTICMARMLLLSLSLDWGWMFPISVLA